MRRTITTSEISGTIMVGNYRRETNDYEERVTTVALKATIVPPVFHLNPEAVTRYVGSGNWRGITEGTQRLDDVLLVGSSEEATTIYANVQPSDQQDRNRALFADRTAELLGFMGIATQIVQ